MSDITPAEEFDASNTDAPVCPYCGYKEYDTYDYSFDAREGDSTCSKCGGDYRYTTDNAVFYTTEKLKVEE